MHSSEIALYIYFYILHYDLYTFNVYSKKVNIVQGKSGENTKESREKKTNTDLN